MADRLDVDEVLSRVNIVDLISQDVALKKQGANYVGICPFHSDRNPSMFVSETKQIFKCFSCGVGGNAIKYISLSEKLTFQEALYELADRVGIKYTKKEENNEAFTKLRNDIKSVNRIAGNFFFEELRKSPKAIEYVKKRGLTAETIKKFGIGYAPDSWDALFNHFAKNGVSGELLAQAGLCTKSEKTGSYVDKFRDRLMFPIQDEFGNVIGFGGRIMNADAKMAKYINTQETPVYTKGNNLYGLNIAKKTTAKRIIIVEGFMDCIALHQKGIDFAVASQGTALTENQARKIKRVVPEVIAAFDNDAAGLGATIRSLDILKKQGLDVKVFRLKGAKDADEYLRTHTKEDFLNQLSGSYSLFEYKCILAAEQNPPENNESKIRFIENIKKLLLTLKDTEKQIYIHWICDGYGEKYGIKESMLQSPQKGPSLDNQISETVTEERHRRFFVNNDEFACRNEQDETSKNVDFLEKTLLIIMCENPNLIDVFEKNLEKGFFEYPENSNTYNAILATHREGKLKGFNSLPSQGPLADNGLAGVYFKYNISPGTSKESMGEIIEKLRTIKIDRELLEINGRLSDKNVPNDEKKALLKRFMELKNKK